MRATAERSHDQISFNSAKKLRQDYKVHGATLTRKWYQKRHFEEWDVCEICWRFLSKQALQNQSKAGIIKPLSTNKGTNVDFLVDGIFIIAPSLGF